MKLSDEDLAALTEVLEGTPYRSLRLEAEGFTLHLKQQATGWTAEKLVRADSSVSEEVEQAEWSEDGPAIRAPMIGVFYRAPKPGDPPFVDVGTEVAPDTVVGIIETMKLMNAIPAGISGRISEIIANDATFVDAGRMLMRVQQEPA